MKQAFWVNSEGLNLTNRKGADKVDLQASFVREAFITYAMRAQKQGLNNAHSFFVQSR